MRFFATTLVEMKDHRKYAAQEETAHGHRHEHEFLSDRASPRRAPLAWRGARGPIGHCFLSIQQPEGLYDMAFEIAFKAF